MAVTLAYIVFLMWLTNMVVNAPASPPSGKDHGDEFEKFFSPVKDHRVETRKAA